MSKKDYVKAANIANQARTPKERKVLIEGFILLFENDNPRFDEERFRSACIR